MYALPGPGPSMKEAGQPSKSQGCTEGGKPSFRAHAGTGGIAWEVQKHGWAWPRILPMPVGISE